MSDATKAVFLSYAREDTDAARRVAEALRSQGVEVWFDQEGGLEHGDEWDRKIRHQIKECALFLPVISANTQARREGYFRIEWDLAAERAQGIAHGVPFILPVVIDPTNEPGALVPDRFRKVQWTRLPAGETPAAFVARVQKLLGGEVAGAPSLLAARPPEPTQDRLTPAPRAESAARSRPGEGAERMKRRIRPLLQPVIIAAAVAVGAGLGWMGNRMRSAGSAATLTPALVTRVTLQLPVHAPLALSSSLPGGWALNAPILSPDGRVMLYVASQGATSQIYLRALDQFEAKPIPGTEGGFSPFFSPDSVMFGFFAENKLKKMSIEGGAPVALCEAKNAVVGTWSTEEVIYYITDGAGLLRVPVRGGVSEKVKGVTRSTFQGMPSGKELLLSIPEARSDDDYWRVALFSPQRATVTPLGETGVAPCITASGHLLILRGGAIFAAPLDADHRVLLGRAIPVLEDSSLPGGIGAFSVSDRGTLLYIGGGNGKKSTPMWVDRNGHHEALPMPAQTYGNFRLSPDGRRLAIEVLGSTSDIWIYETTSGKGIRLTTDGNNTSPVWSPDGTRVVYAAGPSGNRKLMVKSLAGGDAKELYSSTGNPEPTAWTPDGRLVLFSDFAKGDIQVVSVVGAAQPESIVESKAIPWGASLSADGAWMAYTSDESGRYENYVQPFPAGPRVQISFDGGEEPLWSPHGGELIFRNGDKWLSVAYATTLGFVPETPREIIKGPYYNAPGISWGFALDAKRLLVLQPLHEQKVATEVKVVLNWFEELKRRVPVASTKK